MLTALIAQGDLLSEVECLLFLFLLQSSIYLINPISDYCPVLVFFPSSSLALRSAAILALSLLSSTSSSSLLLNLRTPAPEISTSLSVCVVRTSSSSPAAGDHASAARPFPIPRASS